MLVTVLSFIPVIVQEVSVEVKVKTDISLKTLYCATNETLFAGRLKLYVFSVVTNSPFKYQPKKA